MLTPVATRLCLTLVAGMGCVLADNQQLLKYLEERANMADSGRGVEEGPHAPLLSVVSARVQALPLTEALRPRGPCAPRVVDACDLKAMARLQLVNGSGCTMLKEFSQCVEARSVRCPSPQVTRLVSGLTHLLHGLADRGVCRGAAPPANQAPPAGCTRAVGRCVASLTRHLRAFHQDACAALTDFRRCVRTATVTCDDVISRQLEAASRALTSAYHPRDVTSC